MSGGWIAVLEWELKPIISTEEYSISIIGCLLKIGDGIGERIRKVHAKMLADGIIEDRR